METSRTLLLNLERRSHKREVSPGVQMNNRVFWITRPDHLKALSSPIRHDIVNRLNALGPLSVSSLAAALGRKPTAIYRHLVTLEKLGLIVATGASGVRGRPAMIYRPAAPLMRLSRAPRNKNNRAPMVKIASAMARQAAREYAAAFKSDRWKSEGPKRNHWFLELLTSPSQAKLEKINALLDELANLIASPEANPGQPVRVTWFMAPSPGRKTPKRR